MKTALERKPSKTAMKCEHCGKQMTAEILYKNPSLPLEQEMIDRIVVSCECGSPRVKSDTLLYRFVSFPMRTAPFKKEPLFPHPPIDLDTTTFPSACPVCGEDTADYDGVDIEDAIASQKGSCPTCGSEWTEHYRISSRVITVNGKK